LSGFFYFAHSFLSFFSGWGIALVMTLVRFAMQKESGKI
jgi:hypothetical protein